MRNDSAQHAVPSEPLTRESQAREGAADVEAAQPGDGAPEPQVSHPPARQMLDRFERQPVRPTGHRLETQDPAARQTRLHQDQQRFGAPDQRVASLPYEPASFSQRFGAFFIDLIIIRLILLIATRLADLDVSSVLASEKQITQFVSDYWNLLVTGEVGGILAQYMQTFMLIFYLQLALAFAYYLIFHAIGGQTPGKYALGIRVTRVDGSPIGFGLSLVRYIIYWLGSKPLYFGCFWAMFNRDVATWHDLAAGTRVYRVASLEAPAPVTENERKP